MIFNVDFSESSQVIGEGLKNESGILTQTAIKEHNADKTAHAELFKDYAKPADIEQAVNAAVAVSEGKAQSLYANAVKGSESGEVIRVDNVSPVEHTARAKVKGKNLFNIAQIQTMAASNYAYISEVGSDYLIVTTPESYEGNGYCTISKTLKEICPNLEIGKTYILTATTESNSTNIYFPALQKSWVFGRAMVATETLLNSVLTFYGLSAKEGMGTGNCRISNIQIEEGSTATDYEPYIDPASVTITKCGVNLLNVRTNYSETVEGVTFTFDDKGKCTINGTNESESWVFVYAKIVDNRFIINKGATVTVAGINCDNQSYSVRMFTDKATGNTIGGLQGDYYKPTTITLVEDTLIKSVLVRVAPGATISNAVVAPSVEIGTTASDYKPYTSETYTPNADGLCDITSLAPTMTLCTDTAGVIIDLEYNKDINKALNNRVKISNGDTITLADNVTYYAEGEISTLKVIYPAGDFISSLEFKIASAGDITITLPQSKYIGGTPTFANGETWELNIKNGVVVGGLVE